MKKNLSGLIMLLLLTLHVAGQKTMTYEAKDSGLAVPRVNNDEAVVIISSPDLYELSFESTMDKAVNHYNTVNESSYNYYFLKFTAGDLYRGRKLEIKVDGYDKTVIPIPLKAKEVLSFYVYDPDGMVGVGCYFQNRNEGNDFFEKAMYVEAKEKYKLALECTDKPEENDVAKRIEDADMCTFLRRKADNAFSATNYEEAEEYYKEVLSINANDEYCTTRVADCEEAFANISRKVYGVVVNRDHEPLAKVEIKGAVPGAKKNKYVGEKSIGFTDENGQYAILLKQQYDVIEFSTPLYKKVYMEIPRDSVNRVDISMKPANAIQGISIGNAILNTLNEEN
ncbi:hypothetical protein C8N47_11055 [Mangrovibacterium marinum]|uniref:Carboxypeptidase family protein n=2 Tax=Mangrovibacterium marinum TaxID=1639118 RepID=A0A2T5C0S4_9BACT|nr:hypothetical protein C8N47_11055 [Mangrovibacterium marinum]